jgi:hypothetical protein
MGPKAREFHIMIANFEEDKKQTPRAPDENVC